MTLRFRKTVRISAGIPWLLSLVMAAAGSCAQEEIDRTDESTGDAIRVSASLSPTLATRAYIEEGKVTEGLFTLVYRNTSSQDTLGWVDFDYEGVAGTGQAISGLTKGPLAWALVGGGNNPTFYMDNVSDELSSNTKSPTKVIFNDKNPYVAGILTDDGFNDLLWGKQQVARNSKTIHFDMHHVMSKVKVVITVDDTNEVEDELSLENAEVFITDVVHKPETYDRLTGMVSIADTPDYADITLVNSLSDTPEDMRIEWKQIEENANGNEHLTVYTTGDFILPPQGIRSDTSRPKLKIKLHTSKGEKVYSGYLPHAMEVQYGDSENPYPLTLSFLREHYLTIRTVLSKEPPELSFMPVQVVEWVDKGKYTLDGYQAGIYSTQELLNLVAYWGASNEVQMQRFGMKMDNGSWRFNIFANLELDWNYVFGKMREGQGQDYSFYVYDTFSITFTKEEVSKTYKGKDAAEKLYNVLRGTDANV